MMKLTQNLGMCRDSNESTKREVFMSVLPINLIKNTEKDLKS